MDHFAKLLPIVALVSLGVLGGCTALDPCGQDEREYCSVDGECTCGEDCDEHTDCSGDRVCKRYRYDSTHGICLKRDWLRENAQGGIPADATSADSGGDTGQGNSEDAEADTAETSETGLGL